MHLGTIVTLLLSALVNGVIALKLTELIVPSHADIGQTVVLRCMFDLERARLYSVKWYKDEFEFYRYMPDNDPQTQVFKLPGINLDEPSSDLNRVTLTQVNFKSTGAYRCEVSTEGPNFDTVFRNGNMTVLAYPDGEPQIFGVLASYSVGDYITANCTSARSNPPPRLTWFINGIKVDSMLVNKYPVMEHAGGLYSKSLGLRFQAEKRHFRGSAHAVELKCTVAVSDLPLQVSVVTPRLSSATNQKLAQERLSNRGQPTRREASLLLALVLCSLLTSFLS